MAWQKTQQQATAAQWQQREKAHTQAMAARYQTWRDQNNYHEPHVTTIEVPNCASQTAPLTDDRRTLLMDYLQSLLDSMHEIETETTFTSPYDTPTPQAVAPLLGKLCGQCNGRCCNKGRGNHAFIQRSTLQRVLNTVEGATHDTVLDLYRAHLPTHAIKDSCAFHTETGCCLPDELRANICGEFFCKSLNNFIEKYEGKEAPEKVLVFSVDDCVVRKEGVIDGE